MDRIREYQVAIIDWIRDNRLWMAQITEDLAMFAEPAFQEHETAGYIEGVLCSFGYRVERPLATSVRGIARARRNSQRQSVIFLADMDAVYCPNHPQANRDSGFAHACGHHIQMVHGLAIAKFWHEMAAWRNVDFPLEVVFAPAEEFASLKCAIEDGQVAISGKQMLLDVGLFDYVKEVVSSHVYPDLPSHSVVTNVKHPGFRFLRIVWSGEKPLKSSISIHQHLEMLHMQVYKKGIALVHGDGYRLMRKRKCFFIDAYIVFHGSYTEPFLLEKISIDIRQGLKKQLIEVDVEIVNGYKPFMPEEELLRKFDQLIAEDFPQLRVANNLTFWRDGATDLGDVSAKVPTIQVYVSGARGRLHDADFAVNNLDEAVYTPVQLFLSYLLYGYKGE